MKFAEIFPAEGLPKTNHAGKRTCHWVWPTEEKAFRKEGHSNYSEQDVVYTFNTHGYRCPEFTETADLSILAVGCSYIFGMGLPQAELACEKVRNTIQTRTGRSTILWNLGCPGASNDFIARTLTMSLPHLNPDIVIVGMTSPNRREYVTADEQVLFYITGHDYSFNPVLNECAGHLDKLAGAADDFRNFFMNYKHIEATLRERRWLWSLPSAALHARVAQFMECSRYGGVLVEGERPLDFARDNKHPGRLHHEFLADSLLRKMDSLGWVTELSRL